jgi:hypothetical protein
MFIESLILLSTIDSIAVLLEEKPYQAILILFNTFEDQLKSTKVHDAELAKIVENQIICFKSIVKIISNEKKISTSITFFDQSNVSKLVISLKGFLIVTVYFSEKANQFESNRRSSTYVNYKIEL